MVGASDGWPGRAVVALTGVHRRVSVTSVLVPFADVHRSPVVGRYVPSGGYGQPSVDVIVRRVEHLGVCAIKKQNRRVSRLVSSLAFLGGRRRSFVMGTVWIRAVPFPGRMAATRTRLSWHKRHAVMCGIVKNKPWRAGGGIGTITGKENSNASVVRERRGRE